MSDGGQEAARQSGVGSGADSRHRVLLYGERQEFIQAVGSFVRDGVASGSPILVTVPAENLGWLESELGADARAVELADAADFYRSQGKATRIMIDWLRSMTAGGRPARVVSEHALGRLPQREVADYLRAEAAANVIFRQFPVSILCPYAAALPENLILEAQRTHPELISEGDSAASTLFTDPRDYVRQCSVVVKPPHAAASLSLGSFEDLATARRFLRDEAAAAGFGREAVDYLLIAVGELLTNALMHGKGPRRLWVYSEGSMLICHIHDSGPGPADSLLAYLVPERHAPHGQGFWLARQLSDSLEMATDHTGTHVRLGLALPAQTQADGQSVSQAS